MNTTFFPGNLTTALMTAMSALAASFALVACGPQNGAPSAAATPPAVAAAATTDPAQAPPPAPVQAPVPVPVAQAMPAAPAPVAAPPAPVAAPPAPEATPVPAAPPQVVAVASATLGQVSGIEPIRTRPHGSGTGAVIGGVLGAVVGNQFGGGTGRVATTALGAVGGAVVGNNIERNRNEGISGYRVSVRLDNGHSRTFQESHLNGLRVGDRVRIEGGRIVPA